MRDILPQRGLPRRALDTVTGTDQRSIERFVRTTLGCKCPDEVFASIELDRGAMHRGTLPFVRLVVGARLLIYVVEASGPPISPDRVEALAIEGRADRDAGGCHRFRLVLATSHGGAPGRSTRDAFSRAVVSGDDRMHLHVVSTDALPDVLRRA
jgi:hypothetical protein